MDYKRYWNIIIGMRDLYVALLECDSDLEANWGNNLKEISQSPLNSIYLIYEARKVIQFLPEEILNRGYENLDRHSGNTELEYRRFNLLFFISDLEMSTRFRLDKSWGQWQILESQFIFSIWIAKGMAIFWRRSTEVRIGINIKSSSFSF